MDFELTAEWRARRTKRRRRSLNAKCRISFPLLPFVKRPTDLVLLIEGSEFDIKSCVILHRIQCHASWMTADAQKMNSTLEGKCGNHNWKVEVCQWRKERKYRCHKNEEDWIEIELNLLPRNDSFHHDWGFRSVAVYYVHSRCAIQPPDRCIDATWNGSPPSLTKELLIAWLPSFTALYKDEVMCWIWLFKELISNI